MSSVPNKIPVINWDVVGIGASTLCVIHCLLLPVLLAFSPTLAHFFPGSEVVHRLLVYALAGIGLIAFRAGYRLHRKKFVLLLLALGMAGVTVGAYADFLLPSHGWEILITFVGSTFLILAHYFNRTLCRSCGSCAGKTSKHFFT